MNKSLSSKIIHLVNLNDEDISSLPVKDVKEKIKELKELDLEYEDAKLTWEEYINKRNRIFGEELTNG